MSKIAYVRVSTQEQNETRQREALAAHGIDKWFIEKASGKNTDRPEFQKMMDWVREGDTIYIHDLSRIARSTLDLLNLLNVLILTHWLYPIISCSIHHFGVLIAVQRESPTY